jgi:hypothetical protein
VTYILIDPPVSPYSSPAEIRDWLDELAELQMKHAGDEEALECIRRAVRTAEWFLTCGEHRYKR